MQVDWSLKLDPDTKALYERMAKTFKGYEFFPPARLHYFSAMNNPPDYVIKGWGAVLTDVQPNEAGGHTVNLSVCPTVQVTGWGTPGFSHGYTEQYWVDAKNEIHYLSSKDIDGRAGMKPFLMTIN